MGMMDKYRTVTTQDVLAKYKPATVDAEKLIDPDLATVEGDEKQQNNNLLRMLGMQ